MSQIEEIEFTWSVTSLDVTPAKFDLANVVVGADWLFFAKAEDGLETTRKGYVGFGPADPASFVDLESLSEEMVVKWIQEILSVEDLKLEILADFEDQRKRDIFIFRFDEIEE
jgi:hypothetical protein